MLTIPSHYNGPVDSGHGGFAAGRFAEFVDAHRASVRLHAPIPLDRPLRPVQGREQFSIDVVADAQTIATVVPLSAALDVGSFDLTPVELIDAAEQDWSNDLALDHPCPTCYGCGHDRSAGTGMELRPGRVEGTECHATRWMPGIVGDVPPAVIWAALDCPSGAPAMASVERAEMVLTGKLSVEIRRPVPGDGYYQIAGRVAARDGRKFYTEAALLDRSGEALAVATATWIAVSRPAMKVAA